MKNLYLRGVTYWMRFQHLGVKVNKSTKTLDHDQALLAVEHEKHRIYESIYNPIVVTKGATVGTTIQKAIETTYEEKWSVNKSGMQSYNQALTVASLLKDIKHVSEIDTGVIRTLQGKLRKQLGSESTCNRYLAALRTVMHHTAAIDKNIEIPKFGMTKERQNRIIFYSKEQELQILNYFLKYDLKEMYDLSIILVDTGMRLMEVLNLQKRIEGRLQTEYKNNSFTAWDTKGGKSRTILTTKRVSDIMQNYSQGFTLTKRASEYYFEKVRKAVGLEKGSCLHCFRHTCATRLLTGTEKSKGISLRELQEWLGHASITTTERYLHCMPDSKDRAIGILEAA